MLEGVQVKIHGRHKPQGSRIGLKGGKKIGGYDRRRDTVKIDEKIDGSKNNKDEPSVTIENAFRRHGKDSIGFLRGIPLFETEIYDFSLKKFSVSSKIARFFPGKRGNWKIPVAGERGKGGKKVRFRAFWA